MHEPTKEDRATFAREVAKSMGISPRQVRKRRQRGEIKSQAAIMPGCLFDMWRARQKTG